MLSVSPLLIPASWVPQTLGRVQPEVVYSWNKLIFRKSYNAVRGCIPSCFSHVRLFATPWTVARQAPLSVGFSRQEYWRGLPCPPPGDLTDPGIKPMSPALQAASLPLSHWEALCNAAAAAKSLQSCPTLCDPMDCSPPCSSVHGIFQARVLEWGHCLLPI